jgi:hypothetical protein
LQRHFISIRDTGSISTFAIIADSGMSFAGPHYLNIDAIHQALDYGLSGRMHQKPDPLIAKGIDVRGLLPK